TMRLPWITPSLTLLLWSSTLPLWADYGSTFIANSLLSSVIQASDQKMAFRFTSRQDANVIGLSIYCTAAQDPPAYLVSLQEDKDGAPSGVPLGNSSVVPLAGRWITLPVDNIPLAQGKVYDLVIEHNVTRGGFHPVGVIGPKNQAAFGYTDRPNRMDPQDGKADPRLNVLSYEGGKWKALDRQPLFALHEAGDQLQGDPYDDPGSLPIHGNGTPSDPSDDVLGGEALHPHCAFMAKAIRARVRRQGRPDAPLNYRVYTIDYRRHQSSLAFEGEALAPGRASDAFQWITIPLRSADHPQGFPDECRYIVFQTDAGRAVPQAPGCEDCYVLAEAGNSGGLPDACDLTFDGGPHLSREAWSHDGGATWVDAFERDADIQLLGPDCSSMITNSPPQTHPLPTPPSLYRFLRP
ncbi:MAG TPA: hypothetical protein VFR02_06140, partial [bacterium]|nr:hypothetical protein [bacterium]